MGHPAINEFCRIRSLGSYRPVVFRRHQRVFMNEVNPLVDERDRLLEENGQLKARLADLEVRNERLASLPIMPAVTTTAPPLVVKRKRGRPRKIRPTDVPVVAE